MTLTQVKTFVSGVLKGWFRNKPTLDKLNEADGKLLYNNTEVLLQNNQIVKSVEELATAYEELYEDVTYALLYEDIIDFQHAETPTEHQVGSFNVNILPFKRIKIFWENKEGRLYSDELYLPNDELRYYTTTLVSHIGNKVQYSDVLFVANNYLFALQNTKELEFTSNGVVELNSGANNTNRYHHIYRIEGYMS